MPGWPLPPGKPAIYPSTPGGVTAPTLSNWQLQYNGQTFGAGVAGLGVLNVEGLGGLGTVGNGDMAFPRDTGEYAGVDSQAGRDPVIDFYISENIFVAMEVFGLVFSVQPATPQPLWFQLPGLELMCSMCRPRSRTSVWDSDVSAAGVWKPVIGFHANDPRLYGQGQTVYNTTSGTSSVTLTADNAGNVECRPVIVLNGGSSGLHVPSINNSTIGSDAVIAFQSGFEVAAGDTVVIDMDTPHTVIYHTGGVGSGGSVYSVYNQLDLDTTTWWTLVPGSNTLVCSVGSGTIADANDVGIWWCDAFML